MLFNRIYSKYYYAIAQMLTQAQDKGLSRITIKKIIEEKLFENSSYIDSFNNVKDNNGDSGEVKAVWEILMKENEDGTYISKLKHIPEKPLTTLEKQWLKTVLLDPKMKLFLPKTQNLTNISDLLSDVDALYNSDTFVYFDKHSKSDPYDNPEYQEIFRTILGAKANNQKINIQFSDRQLTCNVRFLEYSEMEDKFRVIVFADGELIAINLKDITSCEIQNNTPEKTTVKVATDSESIYKNPEKEEISLLLIDEFNALDRMMLTFSDLEKDTEVVGNNTYKVTLYYYKEDEQELISRILSFGSVLTVCEENSEKFNLIRERLNKQYELFSGNPELHIKIRKK